ncbi:hypothetical protein SDC9_112326 [bioreactor metagenome]|uniref:Uncharacterized protein n=1 Tax=bioreactor metagenome TaxID=1076179 RepID=A0A645BIY6_9ZZZZ
MLDGATERGLFGIAVSQLPAGGRYGKCFDGSILVRIGFYDGAEAGLPVRFVQSCACLDGFSESASEGAERWGLVDGSKPIFARAQAYVPTIGNGKAHRRKSALC